MSKHFLLAFVVCAILAATSSAQLMTITESTSNVPVAGSVACAQGGGAVTVQNNYWREYNTTTQGLFAPIFLWGADVGIEVVNTAASGTGSHPCTLTIFSDPTPGDSIVVNIADLVPLASETFFVTDTALTVESLRFTQGFPAFTPNGADNLVITIDTPAVGDQFFIGSNAAGQTSPSYLSSAACGITLPTDTNNFVPGGMMIIMDIVFDPTNQVPNLGRPGTGEDLSMLTGIAGAAVDQTDAKTALASANDSCQILLTSPSGTFSDNNYFVIASVGLQANALGYVDVFDKLWLPIDPLAGLGDISGGLTPLGGVNVLPILGTGSNTLFILPALLAGSEMGLQGFALDSGLDTNNGIYASTRHHIITLN